MIREGVAQPRITCVQPLRLKMGLCFVFVVGKAYHTEGALICSFLVVACISTHSGT